MPAAFLDTNLNTTTLVTKLGLNSIGGLLDSNLNTQLTVQKIGLNSIQAILPKQFTKPTRNPQFFVD